MTWFDKPSRAISCRFSWPNFIVRGQYQLRRLKQPFHSQVEKVHSPKLSSEVVRIISTIIIGFIWVSYMYEKASSSYCVILYFLLGWRGNLKFDHSNGSKGLRPIDQYRTSTYILGKMSLFFNTNCYIVCTLGQLILCLYLYFVVLMSGFIVWLREIEQSRRELSRRKIDIIHRTKTGQSTGNHNCPVWNVGISKIWTWLWTRFHAFVLKNYVVFLEFMRHRSGIFLAWYLVVSQPSVCNDVVAVLSSESGLDINIRKPFPLHLHCFRYFLRTRACSHQPHCYVTPHYRKAFAQEWQTLNKKKSRKRTDVTSVLVGVTTFQFLFPGKITRYSRFSCMLLRFPHPSKHSNYCN